jgi:hypothetical protein
MENVKKKRKNEISRLEKMRKILSERAERRKTSNLTYTIGRPLIFSSVVKFLVKRWSLYRPDPAHNRKTKTKNKEAYY